MLRLTTKSLMRMWYRDGLFILVISDQGHHGMRHWRRPWRSASGAFDAVMRRPNAGGAYLHGGVRSAGQSVWQTEKSGTAPPRAHTRASKTVLFSSPLAAKPSKLSVHMSPNALNFRSS